MSETRKNELSFVSIRNRRSGETVIVRDLRRDQDFAEYESHMQGALNSGDSGALLRFICECFRADRAVPKWAQEKFQNAVDRVSRRQAKSWDDVFGLPLKKGKQLEAARRKAELPPKIWNRVGELSGADESISRPLFVKVGKEFGVSASVAEEMYYDHRKSILQSLTASKNPDIVKNMAAVFCSALPPELQERALASLNPEIRDKIIALMNPGKI